MSPKHTCVDCGRDFTRKYCLDRHRREVCGKNTEKHLRGNFEKISSQKNISKPRLPNQRDNPPSINVSSYKHSEYADPSIGIHTNRMNMNTSNSTDECRPEMLWVYKDLQRKNDRLQEMLYKTTQENGGVNMRNDHLQRKLDYYKGILEYGNKRKELYRGKYKKYKKKYCNLADEENEDIKTSNSEDENDDDADPDDQTNDGSSKTFNYGRYYSNM